MSIIKGTNRGSYTKLTPTYIVSFGYVQDKKEKSVFRKGDNCVVWNDTEKKFVFSFTHKHPYETIPKKYEYLFDVYAELKILERYWYGTAAEKKDAFEKILEKAKEVFSFLGAAASVFAKTFAADLMPVLPFIAPKAKLSYFDFSKKRNEHTKINK